MQPHKKQVRHYITDDDKNLFREWFDALKDTRGQIAILKRIDRMEDGNFGDHSYVGQGTWELRIHFGPGYRVYYGEDWPDLVILLGGGTKRSQDSDIKRAQKFWADYKRRAK